MKTVLRGVILLPLCLSSCSSMEANDSESSGFAAFEEGGLVQSQGGYVESLPEEQLPGDILEPEFFGSPSADMPTWHRERTDHWYRYSECMEERGWPTQEVTDPYTPNVMMELNGWQGDKERFVEETKQCLTEAGPYPMPPERTREMAIAEYERARVSHECFTSLGVKLPEFPSQQKFLDDVLIHDMTWDPRGETLLYAEPALEGKTFREIYEMCPW